MGTKRNDLTKILMLVLFLHILQTRKSKDESKHLRNSYQVKYKINVVNLNQYNTSLLCIKIKTKMFLIIKEYKVTSSA